MTEIVKMPTDDFDFLNDLVPEILNYANSIFKQNSDTVLTFEEARYEEFRNDYEFAIIHFGMTPSPVYDITPVGERLEHILDRYLQFSKNI